MSSTGERKGRDLRAEAMRFAGMSLAVNASMALFKILVGLFSGSHAILASSLYSINDVLSAIAVSVSLHVGSKKANAEYPDGYGKSEFIAVGMVSLAIAIGVLAMFVYSLVDMLRGIDGPPHFTAVSVAVISLAVNWSLAQRSRRLADALQSPALSTSSEHHHADAVGSLAAILGTVAALFGFHAADRLVAIGETLHLVGLSGTLLAKSTKGLMDAALPDEDRALIERTCGEVDGVRRVLTVRSRRVGSETWVDVAVAVSEKTAVQEAELVRQRVQAVIRDVVGQSVTSQVRFQASRTPLVAPGPAGSGHG